MTTPFADASTVFTAHIGSGRASLQTLTDGYALAFWVMVGFGIAAVVATLTLIRREEIGETAAAAPIAG